MHQLIKLKLVIPATHKPHFTVIWIGMDFFVCVYTVCSTEEAWFPQTFTTTGTMK